MVTSLRRRDHLGRELQNATPGTTDPVLDHLSRVTVASDKDFLGRTNIATLRANTTAYSIGDYVEFASNKLYRATVAGTSAGSPPSETGIDYGETLADGATLIWERVS
jgi:hypothetical protein